MSDGGTTLGMLILELGLDPSGLNEGLEQAQRDVLNIGRAIEASLKMQLPTLTPRVDDSALTRLNKHLDLKQRHFTQVNQFMKQNPLTPRVDFSQLTALEKRLNAIRNGNYSPSVRVGGSVSGGGSRGGGRNDDKQLADQIGRAVAQNSRPGIAERAVSAVGGFAARAVSAPGRIVGSAIGGAVQGLTLGATQEVSRNLGKGLSNALEKSLSGSFGSTELIGEKLGGSIANSIMGSFRGKLDNLPKILEEAIDKIQDGKVRSRLKKVLAEAQEIPEAVQSQVIKTLGGGQAISEEGLYQRGKQRQDKQQRTPVSQEQAIKEWRQALKTQDAIEGAAAAAMAESDKKLARSSQIAKRHQTELARLQAELESAAASGDSGKAEQLQGELKVASAQAAGLAHEVQQTQEFQAHISESVAKARSKTRGAYARVKAVTPEQTQPKAYADLMRETVGRDLSPEQMPTLRVADGSLKKAGALSQYDAARNAIEVTRETFEQIKKNALTPKQIEMLKEEIEHAVDFDFGSHQGIQAIKQNRVTTKPVTATPEEFAELAPELGLYSPEKRALELNAKVKAKRGMSAYEQAQRQQTLLDVVPTLASNKPAIGNRQKEFQGQLQQFQTLASQAGNDVSESVAKYEGFFNLLQKKIEELVDEILANPQDLDPAAVNAKIQKMGAYWSSVEGLSDKVKASTVDQIDQVQQQKAAANAPKPLNIPIALPQQPELELVELPPMQVEQKASADLQKASQQQAAAIDHQNKAAQAAAKATQQSAKAVEGNASSIASKALAEAKKLDANFAAAYQQLQTAIKEGDAEAARALNLTIQEMAEKGKASLDKFSAELKAEGAEMGFGSELSSKLGQVKGRLTQKSNLAKKNTSKFEAAQAEAGEDLKAQHLSGDIRQVGSKFTDAIDDSIKALDSLAIDLHATTAKVEKGDAAIKGAMPDIPSHHEIAAMDGAQPAQVKSQMQARLEAHHDAEASGEDLTAQHRRFGTGLNPNQKRLNPAEKVFLEETIKTLEHAEAAWRRYGQVVGQVEKQVTEREAAANAGLEKALNPDAKEWEERIQKRIAELDATIAELENGYNDRLNHSQQSLDEHLEHRAAYAEMMGIDPDSAEAMAIVPPKPKEDGFFKALMDDSAELPEKLGKLGGLAKTAALGFLAFGAAAFVAPMLKDIGLQSIEVAAQMEQLTRTASFAYGSRQAGAREMATTRANADRLGIDAIESQRGRIQLAASTRGTNLEGGATDAISSATDQAVSVMGLDTQGAERVNTAISQMASKGKISAEELRQQLGETLPGAFQIAARAMGTTTSELDKMMQRGELLSEDFLPKFANQLSAETASGVAGAAHSSQAALNNYNNSLRDLQATIGKPLLAGKNVGLEILTTTMNGLIKILPLGLSLLGGFAGLKTAEVLFAVGKAALASAMDMGIMALGMEAGTIAAKGFGMALGVLEAAAPVLLFTALVSAVQMVSKSFKDAGGDFRAFATSTQEGLSKLQKDLGETGNSTKSLVDRLPKTRREIQGETYADGNAVGGIFGLFGDSGKQYLQRRERNAANGVTGLANDVGSLFGYQAPDRQGVVDPLTGRPQQTFAEKKAGDEMSGLNDSIAAGQVIRSEIQKLIDGYGKGEGQLANYSAIGKQIEGVQAQRRALLPGDVAGRRRLDVQEQDLQKQQTDPAEKVASVQTQQAAYIQGLRDRLKNIEEQAHPKDGKAPTITGADYTQSVTKINAELKEAIAQQDTFNKLIGRTPDALGRLARGFADIQGALEKTNMELERSASASRKTLASAQIAGGMSPGELDFARTQAEQQNLQGKIGANEKSIQQQQNLLNSPDILKVLKTIDPKLTPDNINPTTLAAQAEGRDLSDQDKGLVQQAIAHKQSIDSLKTENGNIDAQIEESKAQAVQKLRDLATQIYDFYRGIEQSAKEIKLNAQAAALQNKTQMAQAKLKSALVGFQESFINDFVESLISMVETLNKPMEAAISAQQQMLSAQNSYFQQVQQAFQMQQQLPSIGQVAGQEVPMQGMLPQQNQANQGGASNVPVLGQPGSTPGMPISAMPGMPTAGAMPANTSISGVSPSQISGPLSQLQSMNPTQAATFGTQGLQSAVGLAGQNYQSTAAMIQQGLAAQRYMAGVEARSAASNATHQLYLDNRHMDDGVRERRRSLEDVQSQNQIQTPEVERQSRMRGVSRDFEDRHIAMDDTMRGLNQTIEQATQTRNMLIEGINQGLFPPEMRQFVAQLDDTIRRTHGRIVDTLGQANALNQAEAQARSFAAAEEKRKEGDRQFGIGQKASEGQIALYGAQAQAARNRGDGSIARGLDYRGQVQGEDNKYSQITHDLENQLHLGQLTNEQYKEQLNTQQQIHATNLANLEVEHRRNEEEARRTVREGGVTLGNQLLRVQAQGDRLTGDPVSAGQKELQAQQEETRQATRNSLHDLDEQRRTVGMTTATYKQQHDTIVAIGQQTQRNNELERIKEIRDKGGMVADNLNDSTKIGAAHDAIFGRASFGENGSGAAKTTAQLLSRAKLFGGNSYVDAMLAASGRSDVVKLSMLSREGGFKGTAQAQELAQRFDAGQISKGDLSAKLDQLIAAVERGTSRPNLSITNVDDIGTAGQIYSDISRGNMRNAGI